jgi:hypothetical protein
MCWQMHSLGPIVLYSLLELAFALIAVSLMALRRDELFTHGCTMSVIRYHIDTVELKPGNIV